ncbi:Multidrug resistance protein 1, partial [Podila epigama]
MPDKQNQLDLIDLDEREVVQHNSVGIDMSATPDPDKIEAPKTVSYFQLYRFASLNDRFCILLGIFCSIAAGVGQPIIALLMGNVVTTLSTNTTREATIDGIRNIVIQFAYVGAIMFVAAYGQMCLWTLSAESQTKRIRERYLHAILRQDMAWHDTATKSESLNARLASDTQLIFDGLADKVGLCLNGAAAFITGFVIAFIHSWRMTLVITSVVPLVAASASLMYAFSSQESSTSQGAYAAAGGMAEQAISGIRTVVAFGGQRRELERYNVKVDVAYKSGVKKAVVSGLGMGLVMALMILSYSLAFWYGARQVADSKMESGDVLAVLFGVIIGASALGSAGGSISGFGKAKAAAYNIFKTIDR